METMMTMRNDDDNDIDVTKRPVSVYGDNDDHSDIDSYLRRYGDYVTMTAAEWHSVVDVDGTQGSLR